MHTTTQTKTYYPDKQACQDLADKLTSDDPEWVYACTEGRYQNKPMWYVAVYDHDYLYMGTL